MKRRRSLIGRIGLTAAALVLPVGAAGCGGEKPLELEGGGGGGGAAGADFTCEAMAPSLENPSDEPGFAVTTDGRIVEFRENVSVWNDRPPTLEIFANTTEEGWTWFRLFIFPKGDEPSPTPGEYRCGRDEVTVLTLREDGLFDTRWSGSGCTVLVSEASLQSGSRFAGTFCARLVTEDGTGSLTVTAGSFLGVVGGT